MASHWCGRAVMIVVNEERLSERLLGMQECVADTVLRGFEIRRQKL
jgi:hypothetical protein